MWCGPEHPPWKNKGFRYLAVAGVWDGRLSGFNELGFLCSARRNNEFNSHSKIASTADIYFILCTVHSKTQKFHISFILWNEMNISQLSSLIKLPLYNSMISKWQASYRPVSPQEAGTLAIPTRGQHALHTIFQWNGSYLCCLSY